MLHWVGKALHTSLTPIMTLFTESKFKVFFILSLSDGCKKCGVHATIPRWAFQVYPSYVILDRETNVEGKIPESLHCSYLRLAYQKLVSQPLVLPISEKRCDGIDLRCLHADVDIEAATLGQRFGYTVQESMAIRRRSFLE